MQPNGSRILIRYYSYTTPLLSHKNLNLELLRYTLFLFVILGLLVSGGLFFNGPKANKFLAAYVFIYALEQLDFLYVTGPLLANIPEAFMLLFPICLLAGPMLWFYFKTIDTVEHISIKEYGIHLLPFLTYLGFTCFLLTFNATARLEYVHQNYATIIVPLNYFKVVHVLFYGGLMLWYIRYKPKGKSKERRLYLQVILLIYGLTALVLTYLTACQYSYTSFIFYLLTSSLFVCILGYILWMKPQLLKSWRPKYLSSSLDENDLNHISEKILQLMNASEYFTKRDLNLNQLCQIIGERKHHVSQTFSDKLDTTFNQLLNQNRIEFAKSLLADTDKQNLKILAIAIESGFTSKSTFNRAFTKYANCTPSQYRIQQQKQGANN